MPSSCLVSALCASVDVRICARGNPKSYPAHPLRLYRFLSLNCSLLSPTCARFAPRPFLLSPLHRPVGLGGVPRSILDDFGHSPSWDAMEKEHAPILELLQDAAARHKF